MRSRRSPKFASNLPGLRGGARLNLREFGLLLLSRGLVQRLICHRSKRRTQATGRSRTRERLAFGQALGADRKWTACFRWQPAMDTNSSRIAIRFPTPTLLARYRTPPPSTGPSGVGMLTRLIASLRSGIPEPNEVALIAADQAKLIGEDTKGSSLADQKPTIATLGSHLPQSEWTLGPLRFTRFARFTGKAAIYVPPFKLAAVQPGSIPS